MLVGMCVTWLNSRGVGFWAKLPRLEVSKKSIHSFVVGELSFLKLSPVLVGLSGGLSNFS